MPAEPRPERATRHHLPGWGLIREAAIAAEGVALAVLMALHGSPALQFVRAVVALVLTGAVLALRADGRRWWTGIRPVVVGFLGTVVGAGIGGGHALKGDLDATMVAGLVVLTSGVLLLVGGTAVLLHEAHRWWKLLAVPLAYVALELGALPAAMGVYAANVPHVPLGGRTPASLGLAYETVTVRAIDGVALSAWYVPSRNGAAVVVLPGAGSNRDAVLPEGAVLARHGFGVLLLDHRGHGASAGDANDFGWYGDHDLAGAVTWLARRPDVTGGRIALLGESMGGEEAIGAIGADPRVRAAVAEGATGRVAGDRGWLPHDLDGTLRRAEAWVTEATTALLSGAAAPPTLSASLRAAAPRPVLLVAGRDELRPDRALARAAPGNVQLLELPDTAHTAGLATHPLVWATRVVTFLDRSLGIAR